MVEEFAWEFEEQWKRNQDDKGGEIEVVNDDIYSSGGEVVWILKQTFAAKEQQWKELLKEEETKRKRQEVFFQEEGESFKTKMVALEGSIEKLKEDHKIQMGKLDAAMLEKVKENEALMKVDDMEVEQDSEKIEELNICIKELKEEAEKKIKQLEQKSISIEDLRKMYRAVVWVRIAAKVRMRTI